VSSAFADLCPEAANRLSEQVGGFDCDAPAVVGFRSPFDLTNPTLPVLELLMVLGAVAAVVVAVRRLRRDGDPTPMALVIAGVAYVLVVEVPLYFPGTFGVEDEIGTIFVHNVFSVEFLLDRLPLYIVCLYVALPLLAYEIVRSLGIFERRGAAVGALCAGVVHSAFYEVFDHLGPQLDWWAWNTENPNNHPFFDTVPMTSVTLFSLVAPTGLVFLLRRWVADRRLGGPGLVGRAVAIGALVPLAMTVAAVPAQLVGDSTGAQAFVLAGEFGLAWLVAVPVLAAAVRRGDGEPSRFVRFFGSLYLAVMAVLWATALPERDHVGSTAFVAMCFTAALAVVVAASRRSSSSSRRSDGPAGGAHGSQGLGRVPTR